MVTRLDHKSTKELLALFSDVLSELRTRKVVRSTNNPVADYAEGLVATALSLQLLPGSTTGCDAKDDAGRRYEIKGRRLTAHNPSTQLSVLRALDKCHFDFLAGVLFNQDFSVQRACLIPRDVVARTAKFRQHVNGWILFLRPALWEEPGVTDITELLRRAEDS